MTLAAGTRLGSYEIAGVIGAGGMGEVYRARDTKLNRDVAIKVLPELFAADPDRLARFEREAQTLAALNHQNIAQIFGVIENPAALVMEYVDGEDLAQRIGRGAIPLDEALPIARQLADALETAHEQGIVHRDLKPANVKVRADGTVKVLDFGLAKAMAPDAASSSALMDSPTMMSPAMTQLGVIIGTAAYMAPEQARGKVVDRRSDVWAFGCVLYEMLTGRRPFDGEDVSSTLASVLKDDIKWDALPPVVPGSVRRLLRRCLDKDPRRRLSAIGDARFDLDEREEAAGPSPRRGRVSRFAWIVTAAGVVGVSAVAAILLLRPAQPSSVTRLSMLAPESTNLFSDSRESAISPDGTMVAFVTGTHASLEASQLWVRPLDATAPRLVQGATGAHLPFWSPDSRRIGFFADQKLKTVAADGGRVTDICPAVDGRGGTWGSANVIVFAPSNAGALMKVGADGGEPSPATSLDAGRKETGHRFPFFLPDGRHFLFAALPGEKALFEIYVASIDGGDRSQLLAAECAPVYTAPGYLLFAKNGVAMAQPFDARSLRLTGEPVALDDAPGMMGNEYTTGPALSASAATLVYLNDPFTSTRFAWVDRDGRETGTVDAPPGRYTEIKLSPDAQRAAVVRSISSQDSGISVIDLVRHGATRITDAPHLNYNIAWSPDGRRLVYTNDGSGTENLMTRDAAGAMPETVMFASPALFKKPESWSPDGRSVLFMTRVPATQNDLVVIPATGGRQPVPYLNEPFSEDLGRFSPDGRWVAYVSDEAGSNDVYVRSFPVPDHKYRVTTDGGTYVWWKRDGAALLIVGADGRHLKTASVQGGAELSIGAPQPAGALPQGTVASDAAGDLEHLLVSLPTSGSGSLSLTVVSNWRSALGKR